MCMIDDAEHWETVEPPHLATARKDHKCGECGRPIPRGEKYERGTFADEYGLHTVKTCVHCVAVRTWLVVQCGGWCYGGVLEDLEEHWEEEDLLRGRYLALAISGMRKGWTRHGEPMRVMGAYKEPALTAEEGT